MELWRALGICPGDVVALTGGGGKTSLAEAVARELQAQGRPVVFTTTTRIFAPADMDLVLTDPGDLSAVRATLEQGRNVCLATRVEEGSGKLVGLPAESIATLKGLGAGAVLVEADGSAGRPLKAPADHEPAIASCTDLVVPVVGMAALGLPLTADVAHRAERVAAAAGVACGAVITPAVAAAALLACTKGAPRGARVVPVIGQADLTGAEPAGAAIAARLVGRRLGEGAGIGRVLLAAPRTPTPVRRVFGDVTALMLAGGASRRFGGAKLLHPWQGRTLMEASLMAPLRAGVREVVVVTGAYHAELVRLLAPYPVRVIHNPDWVEGMSTSLRAGLSVVATNLDVQGLLICLADQPLLPPQVPDALALALRRTSAAVVAPAVGGIRRNPVLFRRELFPELMAVNGDEGGRSVVHRHASETLLVEFSEAGWFRDIDAPADLPGQ